MLTRRANGILFPIMTQDAILHMRIAEDVRAMLDELRRQEPDLPSRSEMVRRLIVRATEKRRETLDRARKSL